MREPDSSQIVLSANPYINAYDKCIFPQFIKNTYWRISFSLVWAALSFGDKIIKMLDSTIDQMPYVVALPAIPVLCIMFYWLFRIDKGRAILLS
jgi:hypothetical protein